MDRILNAKLARKPSTMLQAQLIYNTTSLILLKVVLWNQSVSKLHTHIYTAVL